MTPSHHNNQGPLRRNDDPPRDFYWYAIRAGGICGAIIALAAVSALAFKIAINPVRNEISAAADTCDKWTGMKRMRTALEVDYRAADDSVRVSNKQVLSELHDIHALLLRRHN